MSSNSPSQATDRIRLASLLSAAAELEHCLTCRYLFAALSLKREIAEGGVTLMQLEKMRLWAANILKIARQEMEHLGLVNNILTAIGEAPHFARPDFPAVPGTLATHVPFSLDPFGREFLVDSLLFELPNQLSGETEKFLEQAIPDLATYRTNTLEDLYDEIIQLIQGMDGRELFIGPPGAQLTTPRILPVPLIGVSVQPRSSYDVTLLAVVDQTSALAALRQIIAEGEGTPDESASCHFTMFLAIFRELIAEQAADPNFAPARPVVRNPTTRGQPGAPGLITNPAAIRVSNLFDLVYETMLLMLQRFWTAAGETAAQMYRLERTIFYPLMTMGVRSVAEVLTQLPARDESSPERAGPTFQIGREVGFLPHRHAAWRVMLDQLHAITARAAELAADPVYAPAIQARFTLMSQNFERLAADFKSQMLDPSS